MSALARGPLETMPPPFGGAAAELDAQAATTVLVVDGDGVSRRFVELALEQEGFQVETALDGAGALEILGHTSVQTIIAETELLDMNGLTFFRRLCSESRLRHVPFLFLSSDARVATRVVAFGAGVDDFLIKPCEVTELVARIKSVIGRERRALDSLRHHGYMLAGRFSALAFPDLVSIVEQARRSGILSVLGARSSGAVYFDDGRVVHAIFGNLTGARAFQAIMSETDAQFDFTQEPCQLGRGVRTIHASATSLILEAARLIDHQAEAERQAPRRPPPPPELLADGTQDGSEVRTSTQVVPAPALGTSAGSQFELGVADSFTLGDLRLYSTTELARWTRAAGGRQRLHVHLLADLTEGVSSILSLAGAPGERLVLGSLSGEPKALGLSFFLRHERMLDLVLLDIKRPKAFLPSLQRQPSLVLVAPPGGDFLSIGIKARVELEQLLEQLQPPNTMAVGNAALEPMLRALPGIGDELPGLGGRTRLRAVHGRLGQGEGDLRALLVAGVRFCAGLPPRSNP
jgi:DNA-binding response OmpR family regulator